MDPAILVRRCGKFAMLDRMLVKLHATGARCSEFRLLVSPILRLSVLAGPCQDPRRLVTGVPLRFCPSARVGTHICQCFHNLPRHLILMTPLCYCAPTCKRIPWALSAGHRVLLFSTMTKLLDLLEAYLSWRRVGSAQDTAMGYLRIDGSTSLDDRCRIHCL